MKYITSLIILIISFSTQAQDLVYSQYWNNAHFLNPALSGLINSNMRVLISNRTQWANVMNKPFETYNLNLAFNLGEKPGSQNNSFGFDINLLSDKAGAGNYGITQIGSGFSFNKRFGSSQLGTGFQMHYNQIGVDPTKLIFEPTGQISESLTFTRMQYFDIAFGINYIYNLKDKFNLSLGSSGFNLNRPAISLVNADKESKSIRWSHYITSEVLLNRQSNLYLNTSILYSTQDLFKQLTFGGLISKLNKTKKSINQVYAGIWYRVNDAIIPSFQMRLKSSKIGLSYDINISDMSKNKQFRSGSLCINFSHSFSKKIQQSILYCPLFASTN